jgi:hypothetical protein
MNINVICYHGESPAIVLCTHLVKETSNEWFAIPSDRGESTCDFVCSSCAKIKNELKFRKNLLTACVGCVNNHRRKLNLPLIGDIVEFTPNDGSELSGTFQAPVVHLHEMDVVVDFNDALWIISLKEINKIIPLSLQ